MSPPFDLAAFSTTLPVPPVRFRVSCVSNASSPFPKPGIKWNTPQAVVQAPHSPSRPPSRPQAPFPRLSPPRALQVLRSCVSRGEPRHALDAFCDAYPLGDVILCNRLVRLLCDSGQFRDAMWVYERMRAAGGTMAPSVVTYSTLMSRLGPRAKKRRGVPRYSLSVAETAWLLYENLLQDRLRPDVVVYNSLISAAVSAADPALAWRSFDEMVHRGINPTTRTYNHMLSAVACQPGSSAGSESDRARLVDVERLVEDMQRRGVVADVFTFSTLCDIYADDGDWAKAYDVVGRMRRADVEPNARTWSSVVRAFCNGGELERGRDVLDKLLQRQEHQLHVSVHLYTTLIDAYGKCGRLEVAFELLADMTARGFSPNVHTYSSIINSCGRAGATGVMMEVFAAMQRAGVQPNEVTYSSIVYYSGRAGVKLDDVEKTDSHTHEKLLSKAREMVHESSSGASAPDNFVSLSKFWPVEAALNVEERDAESGVADTITGRRSDGRVEKSQERVSRSFAETTVDSSAPSLSVAPKDKAIPNTPSSGSALLLPAPKREGFKRSPSIRASPGSASCAASDLHIASAPLVAEPGSKSTETVKESTISDDASAREAELFGLLNGHASRNELFQSFLVLGEMKREGLDTPAAYNALLQVCVRASDYDAAVSTFEAMLTDGVAPDLSSYTHLVRALTGDERVPGLGSYQQRKLVRIFLIFLDMQAAGISPDLIFMNAMMDACRQCGAADKAREVFESFEGLGLSPDAATYTSWVLACVHCKDIVQAADVVRRMHAAGFSFCDADRRIGAASVMAGIGRSGQIDAGVALVDELLRAGDGVKSDVPPGKGAEVNDNGIADEEDASLREERTVQLLSALLCGACQRGTASGISRVSREFRARQLAPTNEAARMVVLWRRSHKNSRAKDDRKLSAS